MRRIYNAKECKPDEMPQEIPGLGYFALTKEEHDLYHLHPRGLVKRVKWQ